MSTIKAKKIVKKYSDLLTHEGFPIANVYLYGSYARKNANKDSDIDVAVILNKKRKYSFETQLKLMRLAPEVDSRIEAILLENKDLKKNTITIMGNEVNKHGILIT